MPLRGGNGLLPEQPRDSLSRGVTEVDANAEPRRAHLRAIRDSLPDALPGADVVATWTAARAAVTDKAVSVTQLLAR